MPRNSAAKNEPVPLAAFVPCAWFEVLRSFQKYPRITASPDKSFIYLAQSGNETARLGTVTPYKKYPDADCYYKLNTFELARSGETEAAGTIFRTFERSIHFTTGELNVLVQKGFIRLFIR